MCIELKWLIMRSGYLEALMLLITLSGGLSMMHVSSLMVSCTHWLSTSLVSIPFPVYIMSIAYWRAQASSADHWRRLSRWCSQVSWYSVALLVVSMCPLLYGSSAFSVFSVINWFDCVFCVYQWYVRLRAYGLLATCRELLGSFWGLSLDKLLGSLLGDFSGKLPGERSG